MKGSPQKETSFSALAAGVAALAARVAALEADVRRLKQEAGIPGTFAYALAGAIVEATDGRPFTAADVFALRRVDRVFAGKLDDAFVENVMGLGRLLAGLAENPVGPVKVARLQKNRAGDRLWRCWADGT